MKFYSWDKEWGLQVTEKGRKEQALQLIGGTRKFRKMCGRFLVEYLNVLESRKGFRRSCEEKRND